MHTPKSARYSYRLTDTRCGQCRLSQLTVRAMRGGARFRSDLLSIMRKYFFIRCRAIGRWSHAVRTCRTCVFVASSFTSRRKNIEERCARRARTAENSINPASATLPFFTVHPSTWDPARTGAEGISRVAVPRQRDLEGIRNRGSVPRREVSRSRRAIVRTRHRAHRAALHSDYTTEPLRARARSRPS